MKLLLFSLAALVALGQLTKLQLLEDYLEKYLAAEEDDSVACGYDYDYDYCDRATCLTDISPYGNHASTKGSYWYQKKDKTYRVGNKCYFAKTSCMNCLDSPSMHSKHLKEVSCGDKEGCPIRPTRCSGRVLDGVCCEMENLGYDLDAKGEDMIFECCEHGVKIKGDGVDRYMRVCKPQITGKNNPVLRLEDYLEKYLAAEEEDSVACGYDYDYDHCDRATCLTDISPYGNHASTKGRYWYQKKEKTYRVGNKCYFAKTSCMNCLDSPSIHSKHLKEVSCGDKEGCPIRPTRCSGMVIDKKCCKRENIAHECGNDGCKVECCEHGAEEVKGASRGARVCKLKPLDELAQLISEDISPSKYISTNELIHYGVTVRDLMKKFDTEKDSTGTITASEISEIFQDYDQNGNETLDSKGIENMIKNIRHAFKKFPQYKELKQKKRPKLISLA